MKRAAILFLFLALLLSACGSTGEADAGLDSDRGFIHYGLMEGVCATQDTVYFTSGDLIHYYEKATGISGVLCGKAECEHSTAADSTCNAYIGSFFRVQIYNGRLYWIKWVGSRMQICSMALDGTDHRTDRTVEAGFFASHTGNRSAIFHRGALYIWIEEYAITNGVETASFDMAVVPLDPDEEPYMLFQEELSSWATQYGPNVTMQAYQDSVYLITSIAGSCENTPSGAPDFYDLQIRRYNAAAGELTTLYHDRESPIRYTVEMWATDDGILFLGDGQGHPYLYWLDGESGRLSARFDNDHFAVYITEDLVISSRYGSERSNPSNPWGFTLAPQDIERTGELQVLLRNFAGEVLLDEAYPLSGRLGRADFCGTDGTYAYFLSTASFDGNSGSTQYISLIGVALDGSGAEVLCTEEEYLASNSAGNTMSVTFDDGTTVTVENYEKITVIPGDGGEKVTMTVEELLENGYHG